MVIEDMALIGCGVIVAFFYFLIGLGVARMLAKIKGAELRIFHVFLWFIVCGVFAASGDCE